MEHYTKCPAYEWQARCEEEPACNCDEIYSKRLDEIHDRDVDEARNAGL